MALPAMQSAKDKRRRNTLDGHACPNCGAHLREIQTLTGWRLFDYAIHEVVFWLLMVPFALLGVIGSLWAAIVLAPVACLALLTWMN
jgi:hypothetical protein